MKWSRGGVFLLLAVLLALGLARLRFDVEILNLLPVDLPVAQGIKTYQQNFSNARELIVTLEAPSSDESELAARSLAQALRARSDLVADVVWQPAWMESPAQATELVAYLWLNQPPEIFGELTNRLAEGNLTNLLAAAREQLATSLSPNELVQRGYDPYGLMQLPKPEAVPVMGRDEELFVPSDGRFRLLFLEASVDLTSYPACRAWLAALRRVISEARASGQLPAQAKLRFTGRPAFVTEIAEGMENDMVGSAGGTLAVIGILFWLAHRRLRPLFWLLILLVAILAGTAALGGLFLGTINVLSMGFAAILLGLAEDFGIVSYQEYRSHPGLPAEQVRREVAPAIFWSAVTTSGAFLTLNLSALPGLGQLGSLVAIGILLAAAVMLYVYLPLLARGREQENSDRSSQEKFLLFMPLRMLPPALIWLMTGLLLIASAGTLRMKGLKFDRSPNVLKPKNSEANAALEQIKARFGRVQEPFWVLVPGSDERAVAQRLTEVDAALGRAVSNQLIASYTLPTVLWPDPANQQANRMAAAALLGNREKLRATAFAAGFTTHSWAATENIFDTWRSALGSTHTFWPTNRASRWILGKVVAKPDNGFLALGFIRPSPDAAAAKKLAASWPEEWQRQGLLLSGWELLGPTVFELVLGELPRVLVPVFLIVVTSLGLAFRSFKEVVLSLSTLGFSGVCLAAAMSWLQWEWNLLNLMALPLLLGMGVDFSIHIQLALRRYRGDRLAVRRSVSRALLLAGATTVAGFASLAFSTNAGMASLGKVCALGIALALVTAVYLLPVWWTAWPGPNPR